MTLTPSAAGEEVMDYDGYEPQYEPPVAVQHLPPQLGLSPNLGRLSSKGSQNQPLSNVVEAGPGVSSVGS